MKNAAMFLNAPHPNIISGCWNRLSAGWMGRTVAGEMGVFLEWQEMGLRGARGAE